MNFVIIGTGVMGNGVARMLKRKAIEPACVSLRPSVPIAEETIGVLRSANIILECVSENLADKKFVLDLCSRQNPEALIASCTSSLSISDLQEAVFNPSRFLGMHFMNPPALIPFVEISLGKQTSNSSLLGALNWLESINRIISIVPDEPGFVVNAILFAMLNRAANLIETSEISPNIVDDLMVGVCGHKIGPLATLDLIGLDVALMILENLHSRDPIRNSAPADVIGQLVSEGKLGKKTKQGFYTY